MKNTYKKIYPTGGGSPKFYGATKIFVDEDSNDETFDCGYDLDIIYDSENVGDS